MNSLPAIEVFPLQSVSYPAGLALQSERRDAVRRGECGEALFLFEHPPVITRGTRSEDAHVVAPPGELSARGIDVFDCDRGGDVTYHGPGQLVAYPVIDLRPDRQDLARYLRDLEEVSIRTLARHGVLGQRRQGLTGVWVEDAKICAIGVRMSSWVTSHGIGLNVDPDLSHFDTIVPCGLRGQPVTSLERCLATVPSLDTPTLDAIAREWTEEFCELFGRDPISTSALESVSS